MTKNISFAETIALIQFEIAKARNEIVKSNADSVSITGEQIQMDIVKIEIQMPISFDITEKEVTGSYAGVPIKAPYIIKDDSQIVNETGKINSKQKKSVGLTLSSVIINQTDSTSPEFDVNKVGSIRMTFNAIKA